MRRLSRTTLERIKWGIYFTVPVSFGYGLARSTYILEKLKDWYPTLAIDRPAEGERAKPGLKEEYHRMQLEQALDRKLQELANKNAGSKH